MYGEHRHGETAVNAEMRDNRIRAALAGDDAGALELIWEAFATDMQALLCGILLSRHTAEDVLQEVFVRVAVNRHRVAQAGNLKGYLLRMARNAALNALKQQSRRAETALPDEDGWLEPVAPAAERTGERAERAASALAALPEEQRTVIVLKTFQDCTFREIAEATGLPANTVASRYRYGMEKLRASLEEDQP